MNVSTMFYPARRYGPCVELSNPESRDGVIEKYVRDHLMPVACDSSKSKYWYWQRFMAEDIDFKSCNNAYKELYDRQAFQETIKKCQCSFSTGISYRFKVRLTYAVVKHK